MSEKSGMKDSNLSFKVQSFKNSWIRTVWRCQHYLINWQKYFHSVHTAQPTEWSIIGSVAAPEGRSRVGFSLCEAAERRRREERDADGSRRRRRREERRRREGWGAIGAEGVG